MDIPEAATPAHKGLAADGSMQGLSLSRVWSQIFSPDPVYGRFFIRHGMTPAHLGQAHGPQSPTGGIFKALLRKGIGTEIKRGAEFQGFMGNE